MTAAWRAVPPVGHRGRASTPRTALSLSGIASTPRNTAQRPRRRVHGSAPEQQPHRASAARDGTAHPAAAPTNRWGTLGFSLYAVSQNEVLRNLGRCGDGWRSAERTARSAAAANAQRFGTRSAARCCGRPWRAVLRQPGDGPLSGPYRRALGRRTATLPQRRCWLGSAAGGLTGTGASAGRCGVA